jgi:hypothetical protein
LHRAIYLCASYCLLIHFIPLCPDKKDHNLEAFYLLKCLKVLKRFESKKSLIDCFITTLTGIDFQVSNGINYAYIDWDYLKFKTTRVILDMDKLLKSFDSPKMKFSIENEIEIREFFRDYVTDELTLEMVEVYYNFINRVKNFKFNYIYRPL